MKAHCATLASLITLFCCFMSQPAQAQSDAEQRGSRNVSVLSHLPLGGMQHAGAMSAGIEGLGRQTGDIEIEQEPARPFVYVSKRHGPGGFHVVSITDPTRAERLLTHTLDDDTKAHDLKYFKHANRYYLALAYRQEADPAAGGVVVFDVTGLPDVGTVSEVGRIEAEGGFRNLFLYKHSSGQTLLFAANDGPARVYDMGRFLEGDADPGFLTELQTPTQLNPEASGYHNMYVAFHPETLQDRFYGAGDGGYFIYDLTDLANPALIAQINSAAVQQGQTIAATPDGRYVVTGASYRLSPLRIFDLQPVLDGTYDRVRTAVGAWMADWRNFAQQFEIRWPYVFVAGLHDGLQVFNMRDPTSPYTVGFYRTWDGPTGKLAERDMDDIGAWDIDVRNADGLIVVSDFNTGFWAFTMEAFEGWDGRGWGFSNISSVQDWDNGPDGAW